MALTTKEKAENLNTVSKQLFESVAKGLYYLHKTKEFQKSQEYYSVVNRYAYYDSVDMINTTWENILDVQDELIFTIGNIKIKIKSIINPIANTVTFTTYKTVIDVNKKEPVFVEIPNVEMKVISKNDESNSWKFNGNKRTLKEATILYLDSIIDHYKESDDEVSFTV